MATWMIVVLIVLVIVIIVLFWLADWAAKAGGKSSKSDKSDKSKKEKPSGAAKTTAAAPKTPGEVHAIYEDKDFDGITGKESDTIEQAAEKVKEITANEKEEQEKVPVPERIHSAKTSSNRMREYYEKRWGQRFNAHGQIYGTAKEEESSNTQITQEDVKKLLVLKDLFDKKT